MAAAGVVASLAGPMRPRARRPLFRARALAGIVGPAAFTAAWVVGTIRQHGRDGYTVQVEQISGLAAPDAREPALMVAGFLAYGGCTLVYASALEDALGGPERSGWGPRLVRLAGLGVLGAGLLRRDQMLLLDLDGGEHQSRRNDLHDAASAVAFTAMFFAPVALARRLRADERTRALAAASLVATSTAAAVLVVFQAKVAPRVNGILQRVAVTLPMVPSAALAWWLARHDGRTLGT